MLQFWGHNMLKSRPVCSTAAAATTTNTATNINNNRENEDFLFPLSPYSSSILLLTISYLRPHSITIFSMTVTFLHR
jgi:hypothetical protein